MEFVVGKRYRFHRYLWYDGKVYNEYQFVDAADVVIILNEQEVKELREEKTNV